jgi:hypothetical protein
VTGISRCRDGRDVKIGIDIGGVLYGGQGDDTVFSDNWFDTPLHEGAFETLTRLWGAGHELHIISKCGKLVEERSLLLLDRDGISDTSIIPRHRIHFVRKRHLKAPMAQALELDVFIDDIPEILDSMEMILPHRILHVSWELTNQALEDVFEMGRVFAASKR